MIEAGAADQAAKDKVSAEIKKAGAPYTVTVFINKAVIETLKEFPAVIDSQVGKNF